ncbi:hypothetical protein BDZ97DRAFT_1916054 [Flammula alnicola]|nr:hypothetical protein BDZ97DRAFT_1916054 [Flammula alnicola]
MGSFAIPRDFQNGRSDRLRPKRPMLTDFHRTKQHVKGRHYMTQAETTDVQHLQIRLTITQRHNADNDTTPTPTLQIVPIALSSGHHTGTHRQLAHHTAPAPPVLAFRALVNVDLISTLVRRFNLNSRCPTISPPQRSPAMGTLRSLYDIQLTPTTISVPSMRQHRPSSPRCSSETPSAFVDEPSLLASCHCVRRDTALPARRVSEPLLSRVRSDWTAPAVNASMMGASRMGATMTMPRHGGCNGGYSDDDATTDAVTTMRRRCRCINTTNCGWVRMQRRVQRRQCHDTTAVVPSMQRQVQRRMQRRVHRCYDAADAMTMPQRCHDAAGAAARVLLLSRYDHEEQQPQIACFCFLAKLTRVQGRCGRNGGRYFQRNIE